MSKRSQRRARHQNASQTGIGRGNLGSSDGRVGSQEFRTIAGKGLVHMVKTETGWKEMSSSLRDTTKGNTTADIVADLVSTPIVTTSGGTGTGTGTNEHNLLEGLTSADDHTQYVHNTTVRTISANHNFTGNPTFTTGTFTAPDINGGTIDGSTIGTSAITTSNITVGTGKTLDVQNGTLTLTDNQISGDKVEGGTIAATTITALTTAGITATADIDIGTFDLRANTLTSDIADGTSPLNITSTTKVTNLNADLWDGYQFSDYLNQAVKTTSTPTFSSITTPTILSTGDITLNPTGNDVLPNATVDVDLGDYNKMWKSLYAAELIVETLVAQDVMATIGGRIMVAPTTKLIGDLQDDDTTIDVEHNNIKNKYVMLKTAPEGVAQVEVIKIENSNPSAITGGYRYNIQNRNLDNTVANEWQEGDAVCSLGGSAGEGFIDLTSTSTVLGHSGPTMAIYSRTAATNWNDLKPTVAVGQLSSFVDYSSSDKFGIAIGNDITLTPTTSFKGLTADNTNGLRMFNTPIELYNSTEKRVKITSAGTVKMGEHLDNTAGSSESAKFHWDGADLTLTGAITADTGYIGGTTGWTIASKKLFSLHNSQYIGLVQQGSAHSDVGSLSAFYAGATSDTGENAKISFGGDGKIRGNGIYRKASVDYLITASRIFGNGSDGALSTSGTTNLTRDMYYTSIIVANGQTLYINTNGWRVFIRDSLLLIGSGKVYFRNNGSVGANGGTAGSPVNPGAGGSGSGAGGKEGSLRGGIQGGNGGEGGEGGAGNSVASNGIAGADVPAVSPIVREYTNAMVNDGAKGGVGDPGSMAGAGISDNGDNAGASQGAISIQSSDLTFIIAMRDAFAVGNSTPSIYPSAGACGGGGGSGGGASGNSNAQAGKSGGGGGQGGGGGGHVMVLMRQFVGVQSQCYFEAKGGNGGDGSSHGSSGNGGAGGKGAGGNGGDGGCVTVICGDALASINIDVSKGTKGDPGTNGAAGAQNQPETASDGSDGTIIKIEC